MKRFLVIFICMLCIVPLVHLSGCRQNEFADQRDIERLLPVQTLGFDRDTSGINVTLSTGGMLNNTSPMVITSLASGIEAALLRLQDFSPKDALYYDHVQYILCGEELAEDSIEPVLDWVERSPFMRMDTQVFLAKGSAEETISSASGEMADITERLTSLEKEASARGQHITTLLEIASDLATRGNALCLTVESVSSEKTVSDSKGSFLGNAILPSGYGVLQDGKLIAYLSQAESLGVMLFEQPPTGTEAEIEGTTLELLQGKAEASGQWSEDGTLIGILVTARATAGILEQDPTSSMDTDAINRAFTDLVEDWLSAAVARSQALSCDFLGLEDKVLRTGSQQSRYSGDAWSELFPVLPVTVEAEATIQRGYDRAD